MHAAADILPPCVHMPAALHGLPAAQVQGCLANFLKARLSVALVLDTGLGHALALTQAAAEFVER